MDQFQVHPIGRFDVDDDGFRIVLDKRYAPALTGLEAFGHLCATWWFSGCDDDASRATLVEASPYRTGPNAVGVFASRSPHRPNPLALTVAHITYIDTENAVIGIGYTDADPGSPVLDIKPYTPSLDRVAHPRTPDWCAHWPQCLEDSGDFHWESEFID